MTHRISNSIVAFGISITFLLSAVTKTNLTKSRRSSSISSNVIISVYYFDVPVCLCTLLSDMNEKELITCRIVPHFALSANKTKTKKIEIYFIEGCE